MSTDPTKLANLKSGPQVRVFVGVPGNMFIAIERAFFNVLVEFSALANQQLVLDHADHVAFLGVPQPIAIFMYRHMLCGGNDDVMSGPTKLRDLTGQDLLELYRCAMAIGYTNILEPVKERLIWKFKTTLLSPDSVVKAMALVPALSLIAVHTIAKHNIEQPEGFDYAPYAILAFENKDFDFLLRQAMLKIQEMEKGAKAPKVTPAQKASSPADDPPLAGPVGPVGPVYWDLEHVFQKHRSCAKPKANTSGNQDADKGKDVVHQKKVLTDTVICYSCRGKGHFRVDCPIPKAPKQLREPTCFRCKKKGHIQAACPAPKTCYICGQDDHLSFSCPQKITPGQQKRPKVIQTTDIGGGLQVCDREVYPGEMTRTGMII